MGLRLGVRMRVLMVFVPVAVLLSAGMGALVYVSFDQILDANARRAATLEVDEVVTRLAGSTPDAAVTKGAGDDRIRIVQIVDPTTGALLATSNPDVLVPMVDLASEDAADDHIDQIPGLPQATYIVRSGDAVGSDGRPYTVLVAVATRFESTPLSPSVEFAVIGALGLTLLVAGATLFAVGAALRPVERLSDQVEEVASTGTTPALEVPSGGDELTRLAITMNRVLDRLQSADASRRRFVADAGHELRGPLATVRVLLERLSVERPEQERLDIARQAEGEVNRLTLLVEDLLTLASADERALTLRTSEVDLDDLVLSEAATLKARGLSVLLAVEPVRVSGDAARLGRLLRNLVENAERHREASARISVYPDGKDAVLVVDNDGPVIPAEHRESVFGRFVRLDDSRARATGGAGLGLAIVAEVAAAHGGTVVASVAPDGWCRFEVRLPRHTGHETRQPERSSPTRPDAPPRESA